MILSLSRKLKRNKEKKFKKDFKSKVDLFDKMGDHCLSCQKSFDKKDKEQVSTWNVVVREKENRVNLYCPDCWGTANKFINNLKEQMDATRINEE